MLNKVGQARVVQYYMVNGNGMVLVFFYPGSSIQSTNRPFICSSCSCEQ